MEAELFLACSKIGGLSQHPFGIACARPEQELLTLRLVNEPCVLHYWIEFLLPRLADEEAADPQDQLTGVAGLRFRHESGGVCLYLPGMPARIRLTGFHPRWWKRIVDRLPHEYGDTLLHNEPDWTPVERAAYAATASSLSPRAPASVFSDLLRRIRATAGPGEINATDAWRAFKGFRMETTDGPPCPDLIRLLGDGPTGLGWVVDRKVCTCLCDHFHADVGCNISFRMPATGGVVYYSNAKWGRTLDGKRKAIIAELNQAAFR
ncbi:hypothetical protein [Streptomyces sp. NPDC055243]|uniref:hypothetical protein n=1 Tax=Streptomyces sp. NPDC055243 TaxID=3365720 RepID=UPI0037D6CECA